MIDDRVTIGELARRTGVSVKALRFYDGLGILEVAGRSESNYRLFNETALACVRQIRRLQAEGLTLRQVQAIVVGRRRGDDPLALLRGAYADALARTEQELAALGERREILRAIVAAEDGDLTFQRGGGCSVCGEAAPRDAAALRRYTWPAKPRPSSRSAATWRGGRGRAKTSTGSRRSSPSSLVSSFGGGR